LSQTSKQLVAQLFPHDSLAYIPTCLDGMNRVVETTSMRESNGTNLKPIPPILFFNKRMKIRKY
jgi:hypothetical protein